MNFTMSRSNLWIVASFFVCAGFVQAEQRSDVDAVLRKTGSFALGGVGVAGSMSEGERALREVLKEPDAIARLESALPNASPAGQLYALLGLRGRDRAAYQRALEKYGGNNATLQTMRGCMLQKESFRDLVKQIEHGDYDTFLSREWPGNAITRRDALAPQGGAISKSPIFPVGGL
ncbi:MAG: hypothetical protein V7609_308 [Verrucomicrobiota bacterium]